MELTIQELSAMLLAFVMSFALGYLCWKHKADVAIALLVMHVLAWGGGLFGLALLSWAIPNRDFQGLRDMLVLVLISGVGIFGSSFFVALAESNTQPSSDVAAHGVSTS